MGFNQEIFGLEENYPGIFKEVSKNIRRINRKLLKKLIFKINY